MTATDTTAPSTPAAKHSNSAPQKTAAAKPAPKGWGKLARTMLIPFFLCAIMGLFYLGAFHQPTPHNVQVAVVGDSAATKVFAQTLQDESDGALNVRTVDNEESAKALVENREIVAAYESTKDSATLYVSSAASETSDNVAQKVFMNVAFKQGQPFQVNDVVPTGDNDTSGQGLFFLLVALSIGGYASAVPLAGFMGKVRLPVRFAMAAVAAAVIATIAVVVAGPIYQVIENHFANIWLISWVYAVSIIMLGMGLHPLLRHWTTPILTMCFVALNFTSSGGIFQPAMQPGFFGALNTFWNGAGWLHAVQTLVYFPEQGIGMDILRLILWLIPGMALMCATHAWSAHNTRLANENAKIEEVERTVAA
ncbi:ABC transporter permease [Glutamicibacter mishrai]|uniref:ABC-2 type transporter transmembrane domain-containing protein n=1 Tax=Glutamicibacter mishrai TaxID=1775880 RepID=A0A6H0SIJ4_9MICC|nr:ABC transporter permease [Glutamicibacter mishrai]QIV87492.1 hypothetical protein D3791_10400 [Glutamicibacter mishrai]